MELEAGTRVGLSCSVLRAPCGGSAAHHGRRRRWGMKRIVVLLCLLSVLWPGTAQTFIRSLPTSTNLTSATKVPVDDATYGTRAVTLQNLLASTATNATLLAAITNVVEDTATSLLANKLDTTNGTAVNLTGSATNLILRNTLAPVTAYGATGDNSTDDAADIQEALDSGNPVFIPAGTYRVASKISVPSNARIYGAGDSSVIRAGSSSISAFEIAGKTNILIQGVSFLGASNNSAASSATGNAIYITNSSGIRITDAKIRYFNTGVYVTGNSQTVRIDGQSEFVGNARAALNTDTASDVVIYGAKISGDRTSVGNGSRGMVGVWFQAGGWDNVADKCNLYYLSAEGVNIKSARSWAFGCHIEDADNGVIFETDGGDVTSSDNGSYGGAIGNTATNIAGIGVFAGNTIGVNNAAVHHVTIIGNVISGAEYGMSFAGLNSSATNERPYALTVKGNIVNGTTVGGGILINANDSVFEGNIIRGAYTDGIQLYRGTNVAIIGNVISGPRNNGIYAFTGGLNNAIRGNSIFGGSASAANTYDGLRIASQTNAMIAGNIVSGSDWRYLASDESSSVGTMWADNDLIGSAGTAVFNFAGTSGTRLNNYSGTLNVNDAAARVGIGTASPRTTAGGQSAKLHIVGRNILFGGDSDTTETDDASKVARISVPPRDTTAGVDVTALQYDGGAANNVLTIGGGTSANYAMSRVVINTGTGVSTTGGTERLRVDGSGNVSIGTGADAGAKLEVAGSVLLSYTGALSIRNSAGSAQTIASYTDGSGVIIGNGVTDVRIIGGTTNGISLGQSSSTANVTIPRKASADATTNLVDSNQLRIGANIWDGSSGADKFMRLANFATSTNGPVYYLGFSDNEGNLRLALTNNGNLNVATGLYVAGAVVPTKTETMPTTSTLSYSGTTVTLTAGGRREYSHTLIVTNAFTLNISGATDGDRGIILCWPAVTTNCAVTLTSPARAPSGGITVTAAGSASAYTNYTAIEWQVQSFQGTNVITANGLNYQ